MYKRKWYLHTWFISLNFLFFFLVVPLIVGIVLLVKQQKENKKLIQEWEESGFGEAVDSRRLIEKYEKEKEELEKEVQKRESKVSELDHTISDKEQEILKLDEEILYQSVGIYEFKYDFETSEQYKTKLKSIREEQKEMVKGQRATIHPTKFEVNGDRKKGNAMINNIIKLTLRSFNNECDSAINGMKFNNVETVEKKIRQSFKRHNDFNKHNQISIVARYLDLKLDEMYVAYEYAKKKEKEKEEQRRIKEQMQEEKRVQQEIEKQRKKAEKEEQHFEKALEKEKTRLEAASDEERSALEAKIAELESQLNEAKKEKDEVDYRAQNQRAGYVYIISNLGSFGENVYKIGMTRRLEPMDRVKELGDASVPFTFDVHAMMFSDDAPSLEANLHQAFKEQRVNKMNHRKEFFRVALKDIEQEVKANHSETIEFTKVAEAEEFRETLRLDESEEYATA